VNRLIGAANIFKSIVIADLENVSPAIIVFS
jgi:hypothetical protein